MELEIAKFFLDLKGTIVFDAFKIITGKAYIVITVMLFVIYAVYRLRIRALSFILAVIIAVAVSDLICYRVLKPVIGRLRPSFELSHLNKENKKDNNNSEKSGNRDFSMPSNHASNIFAFFIVYFIYVKKFWILAFFNSILIAVSRVVIVKHYPTDVLAGIITGTLIGLCVVYLFYLTGYGYKARTKEAV